MKLHHYPARTVTMYLFGESVRDYPESWAIYEDDAPIGWTDIGLLGEYPTRAEAERAMEQMALARLAPMAELG